MGGRGHPHILGYSCLISSSQSSHLLGNVWGVEEVERVIASKPTRPQILALPRMLLSVLWSAQINSSIAAIQENERSLTPSCSEIDYIHDAGKFNKQQPFKQYNQGYTLHFSAPNAPFSGLTTHTHFQPSFFHHSSLSLAPSPVPRYLPHDVHGPPGAWRSVTLAASKWS